MRGKRRPGLERSRGVPTVILIASKQQMTPQHARQDKHVHLSLNHAFERHVARELLSKDHHVLSPCSVNSAMLYSTIAPEVSSTD